MRHKAKIKRRKPLTLFTNTKLLHSKSTYFYKNKRFSYAIPSSCGIALLLISGLCINPSIHTSEKANAVTTEDLGNGSSISFSIYNSDSEVADSGTVSASVQPGQISYISNTIKINTTNVAKYYVGVQSATTSSVLTGQNTSTTIAGVGNKVTTSNFGNNTWGYVLTDQTGTADSSLTYSTLPSYSAGTAPQYTSANNPSNGNHDLKLTFAAKITNDKPADHYQARALLSVAAEAKAVTAWGITTMQEMTSDICNSAENNTTGQLRDTRDNKTYWVTKINGECWMTQNLALDLSTSQPLTSADTDVPNGNTYTPEADTQFTTITTFPGTTNYEFSFNPGDLMLNPTASEPCSEVDTLAGCPGLSSAIPGLATDMTGDKNARYLIGNYYSFRTATFNSSSAASSYNARYSICPAGWTLPAGTGTIASYNKIASTPLAQPNTSPYNFILSGYVSGGGVQEVGTSYDYWTGYAGQSSSNAFAFSFYGGNASVTGGPYRYYGMSIRCVAK